MATFKVGVRHRDGRVNHYVVNNVEAWNEARDFVLASVPSARVVLAVVDGVDRRRSAPVVKDAA